MGNCGRFVFYNNIYVITKNQKQNNRQCVICHVISMVYTLTDHSSRPMSARGFAQFNIIVIIVSCLIVLIVSCQVYQ